jgi:hypothetical protein
MPTINIVRDPESGEVTFDPPNIQLVAGDFVIWANQDPDAAHHPTQENEPADYWMDDPLPKYEDGEPPATSPAIALAGPPDITYVDALDSTVPAGKFTF